MRHRSRSIRIGLIAASVAAILGTSPAAYAQTPSEDRGTVLLKKILSGSKDSSLNNMSDADKKLVQAAMKRSLTADVVADSGVQSLTPSQAASKGISATAAAGGCWYRYRGLEYKIAFVTAAQVVQRMNWCSNGSSITSYNMDPYYAAGKNGFSASMSSPQWMNVGWEVRGLNVVTMTTFNGISTSSCPQIRGGATGLYSQYADNCQL